MIDKQKLFAAVAKQLAEREYLDMLEEHVRLFKCRLDADGKRVRHFCGMKEPTTKEGESK